MNLRNLLRIIVVISESSTKHTYENENLYGHKYTRYRWHEFIEQSSMLKENLENNQKVTYTKSN
jgi:hypothetical protein